MNCASLEAMLADLVWIEEKKEPLTSAQFLLFLILGKVCLVLILVLIVHYFFPQHHRRLKWIVTHKPDTSDLTEIHSIIKKLNKKYPQLETLIPELDELRFGPPPSEEQLRDFYKKIRDICG